MEMRFEYDPKDLFYDFMDTLFVLYPFPKKTDEEKEKIKKSYWKALHKTFSSFDYHSIWELLDVVKRENDKWFPTFQKLEHTANIFNTTYINKEEKQFSNNSQIKDCDIDLLNYYELKPEEAKEVMIKILTPKLKKERVEQFMDTYALIFRQFIRDDYVYFYHHIKDVDAKHINGKKILNFFADMRIKRVHPRLEKITKFGLQHDWHKKPSEETIRKLQTIMAQFKLGKDLDLCG